MGVVLETEKEEEGEWQRLRMVMDVVEEVEVVGVGEEVGMVMVVVEEEKEVMEVEGGKMVRAVDVSSEFVPFTFKFVLIHHPPVVNMGIVNISGGGVAEVTDGNGCSGGGGSGWGWEGGRNGDGGCGGGEGDDGGGGSGGRGGSGKDYGWKSDRLVVDGTVEAVGVGEVDGGG
ncbi:ubiquitin-binding protein Rv1468c-like [Telopea speciosissima]|uniref:ubiquitin-binding protein Rv1468c-like n=1 Tax=Telopea speciosissima TaxID=54955 RepID=UPI001CC59810|nr:ubiquitin-binding protein Rv1468c-like [Telopea speciosissima]